MAKLHYHIQLHDSVDGSNIITAGGTCHVAKPGSPDKATLYSDKDGTTLANPFTLTRGAIDFWVDDTVASADLYIMAPGGQFIVSTGVIASGPNEIRVNTALKRQVAKIPFSIADSVAATEKDTGFDLPATCMVFDRLHGCGLLVTTLEAAKTIDFGLGEVNPAESGGDANGLIAASSLAAATQVIGTNGALFSSNAPHKSDVVTAKSLTYTLSTGTTLAKGFILMPYQLV